MSELEFNKNPLFPDDLWDGTTGSYPDRSIDTVADPLLNNRQISEIVALEAVLSSYLVLLNFLKNVGNANSILGVDNAGVDLEYKDLVEGEGIEINHSANQIEIISKAISGVIELTNNETATINICQPVYINAADGVKLAQANTISKADVIGLVKDSSIASSSSGDIQINGILIATTTQWDTVTGDSGGLTPNVLYYLDTSSAGKLTNEAPATSGNFVVQIGLAISSTKLNISIQSPIGLS